VHEPLMRRDELVTDGGIAGDPVGEAQTLDVDP
jgi:hypothetical protein